MNAFPFEPTGRRILVTGARSPAAPDLVRWLTALGHTVTVADSLRFPLARACRATQACLRYPSPRHQFTAFAAWMTRTASRFDWIWPACEEVFWLAQIGLDHLFAPSWEVLQHAHHKDRLHTLIDGHRPGFAVPPSIPWVTQTVPTGMVAKPVCGRFGHRTLIGPRRHKRRDAAEPWILQPRIQGRERCLYAIAHTGRVLAAVIYADPARRGSGPCRAFRREVGPEFDTFLARFCAVHAWTGQIGFDVITDADARHWIVDANPRLTSGLHLIHRADAAEVALPLGARRGRAAEVPNVLTAPGDNGPAWLAPVMLAEIWGRFGFPLERAATADIQWP